MKKSKIKTILVILIILVTIVLCINIGAYAAYVFSATDVSYTKSNGSTVSVKEALDELNTKVPTKSIGDEVTVGGDKFFVLEWDNNSSVARLITKYNLTNNPSGNMYQTDGPTGAFAVAFSSTRYWPSYNYQIELNNYSGFSSTDAIGRAKEYGKKIGALNSGLLSLDEAKELKNKMKSDEKIKKMLTGTYAYEGELKYWFSSSYRNNSVWVWNENFGYLYYENNNNGSKYGVRPVITVLKSNIS